MFCEAIANATGSNRRGRPAERPSRVGTRADRPSLYASLWHCPDCRTNLRAYASVRQIVTGTVENQCPDCGREMEPGTGDVMAGPSASASRYWFGAGAPSAFAA